MTRYATKPGKRTHTTIHFKAEIAEALVKYLMRRSGLTDRAVLKELREHYAYTGTRLETSHYFAGRKDEEGKGQICLVSIDDYWKDVTERRRLRESGWWIYNIDLHPDDNSGVELHKGLPGEEI